MREPTLQTTALRYAARDLPPAEAEAFEARLADDQEARDALSEAVRLSAAALGQKPLRPHPSFRALLRARLNWDGSRGGPLAWAGLGAVVVAACTLVGLSLADRTQPMANAPAASVPLEAVPAPRPTEVAVAPKPREVVAHVAAEHPATSPCGGGETYRTVAEIWADLSTPEHAEKTRDDELRWRQKVRDLAHPQHVSAVSKADGRAP